MRASILLLALGSYLAVPFQLTESVFWTSGLGDWMDPYFINYLLEHWFRSAVDLHDPASPPMFYPAQGTLGYSHGLVLYAPFYVAPRLFLHPFQAYNLTIFLVLATGTLCFYALLRRFFRLSFVESLLLCALFLASPNVTDGSLGAWSQRASVFLIPPILMIHLISLQMPKGALSTVLALVAGLLSTLLFTQDFHTAIFALFLAIALLVPAALIAQPTAFRALSSFWKNQSTTASIALAIGLLATIWSGWLLMTGGGGLELLGVSLTSRDWRRPALIAIAAVIVWVWLRGASNLRSLRHRATPRRVAFAGGSIAGLFVFVSIYLDVYLEHRAFPESELLNALFVRDPSRWHDLSSLVSDLRGYESLGPFVVVAGLTVLAFAARGPIDHMARLYLLWSSVVSLLVLLMPLRLGDFSIWRTAFEPLPGFSAIRDPKRIIYVYELAVALTVGWFLARLPRGSLLRVSTALLVVAVVVAHRHVPSFVILRPNTVYARWVDAPIDIDPGCRSFYIKPASNVYSDRPNSAWTVYHLDAMYIAFAHSLPTLNGYSAWAPPGWGIGNPQEAGYLDAVRKWIDQNKLENVCELDIERRTMRARS